MLANLPPPQTTTPLPGYALPPVPPNGTRVILMRHGCSDLNDAGRYQGSSDDSQLTAKGRLASRQVGRYCPMPSGCFTSVGVRPILQTLNCRPVSGDG
jgi:hypothetical protein